MYNRAHPKRRQSQRSYNRRSLPQTALITPKKNLDLNCNVGQGFGIYQNTYEEKILPYVTSINIACGAHAGDPLTMAKIINIASDYNLSIGALIGYNDFTGNGQREIYIGVDELRALVLYQLGALYALLHAKGLEIRHVRAHGFLYKQLYTDPLITETVAKAIAEFSKWITLVGLSGPVLSGACTAANIKMGQEVLVHRRYRKDGTVLPHRANLDAKNFLSDSAKRAREIIQSGTISCEDRTKIRVNVDTIHIPSENSESIELARTVRAMISDPKPLHLDKYEKYFSDLSALV
ncbi:MAG: LamB/YcsF family protein [Candidatus Melainabacteria bacterium]|nr:LamB/YcsF family protein [Candidatus Melainabacteria bacterium]